MRSHWKKCQREECDKVSLIIDFQVENELPSNSTNEIPSVSQEIPKKRRRKQEFVERNEI